MQLLYSNILPLGTNENQSTIIDCFHEQLSKADRVDIAVGYTSNASLPYSSIHAPSCFDMFTISQPHCPCIPNPVNSSSTYSTPT